MARSVQLVLGDKIFLAEVDEDVQIPDALKTALTPQPRGVPEGTEPVVNLERFQRQFGDVKELIIASCSELFDVFSAIPEPESVSAEFAVKLGGETGFPMLAKASGEATIKVTIAWKTTRETNT